MAAEATRTAGIGRRASGSQERGAKSSGAGMCGWRPAGGAGGGAGGVVEVLSSPLTSGGDGGGVLPSSVHIACAGKFVVKLRSTKRILELRWPDRAIGPLVEVGSNDITQLA